ncbi:MAG: DUF255 domain-containing protein [Candidatus Dadabacteria bacterium]|nr:DUF255 domain-containing protein [Candidatus Dadabacteria bacterium]NIQ15272.1 DUF255 domain-containing protein [Candidatus Dadabacteria bacterium]
MSNRLQYEKSPYLLQHADNPVDWYPWGEEAFELAKKLDKPILLSIGYSTCHWCHVMEHESFEDNEVAKLMNDTFVSIKVDREERPDIDNVYMTVCHILSKGSCGWPLNIIMTPEKKPFFAATYIPKKSRYGRMGMIELIPKVKDIWNTQRKDILESAENITLALRQSTDSSKVKETMDINSETLTLAYNQLLSSFDRESGGFGRSPKFPTPHKLLFLLRSYNRTGNKMALTIVEKTLKAMGNGGIYDHMGFGFHRYSTDSEWLLPHFEKMLYDQALLSMVYTEAYQLTKDTYYKLRAEQIFEYILRDMTSSKRGFYSAEDADSEGIEGKFYIWTTKEIKEILGDKDADLFIKVYNLSENGNFEDEASGEKTNNNILHLTKSLDEWSKELNIDKKELEKKLNESRTKLFKEREKRVHPYKDDKILTDWNGLMIAAFSKAAIVFNNELYEKAALNSIEFINQNLYTGSRLLHRYRNGEAGIAANVDDYAFFIWGLLEFYEVSFDQKYLEQAIKLNKDMFEHFWDEKNKGFYFTADDSEQLITRQKEIYDGAVPSANSVALLNILRIARITSNNDLEEKAADLIRAFSSTIASSPVSYSMFMNSFDFVIGPSWEIVIVGDKNSNDTIDMINSLRSKYIPNKVVLLKDNDSISNVAPFTKAQKQLNGKATAYVCLNYQCKLPTNDSDQMLKLVDKNQ